MASPGCNNGTIAGLETLQTSNHRRLLPYEATALGGRLPPNAVDAVPDSAMHQAASNRQTQRDWQIVSNVRRALASIGEAPLSPPGPSLPLAAGLIRSVQSSPQSVQPVSVR